MYDGDQPSGGGGETSCPEESTLLEEIAVPTTLFGTSESAHPLEEEATGGLEVVMRKKKPHLPSARERNRNSGILSIVQKSSTSSNSSDEETDSKKRPGDEVTATAEGGEVNIKEYKPLIEFVEEDD